MLGVAKSLAKLAVVVPRCIGYLFPKNANTWVFGAWLGQKYADNPKYLFEYVDSIDGVRAVWLTKSKSVHEHVKQSGRECYYFYSIRGVWVALRAKYLVYCVAFQDLSYACYLFSHNSVLVNLWHGTPLKKLTVKRTDFQNAAREVLISLCGRECDVVGSASEEVTKTLRQYFNVEDESYIVTGYPRNDGLFKTVQLDNGLLASVRGKKVVLYMPTFREYEINGKRVDIFNDFGFDLKRIDKMLAKVGAVLLIKIHFRDREHIEAVKRYGATNVILLEDSQIKDDIYSVLSLADVLVTDYSSVYFDYLLLNRPILFSCFDRERYVSSDRGFYYNYDMVTPGYKSSNWTDLESKIVKVLNGDDDFQNDRLRVLKEFNNYADGYSSKRTYEAIIERYK